MDNLSSISYEEGWQDAATPVRYEHVECRNVVTIVFSGQTAAGGE